MRFVVFLYVTKGVLGIGHLGVSVKRRAGTGVGVEVGSGSLFYMFFAFFIRSLSFFLCLFSFLFLSPNSDLSRYICSASFSYLCIITSSCAYKGNEKRATEVQVHDRK